MEEAGWACPSCGRANAGDRARCDGCGHLSRPVPRATESGPEAPTVATSELLARADRVEQWHAAAAGVGVSLRTLPGWAKEAIARSTFPAAWATVLDELEREAGGKCAEAFERHGARLTARLERLEAYSIDTGLERVQLEAARAAWEAHDLASALWTIPQLDRVVEVKERHLEQTRDDLERLLAFRRDLEAIGFPRAPSASELAAALEPELRAGRLASVRRAARAARGSAAEALRQALPEFVGRLGERLAAERARGLATEGDVRDLALGARAVLEGQPEEGARLLRRVAATRGLRLGPLAPSAPG